VGRQHRPDPPCGLKDQPVSRVRRQSHSASSDPASVKLLAARAREEFVIAAATSLGHQAGSTVKPSGVIEWGISLAERLPH
jgi:hypothetical protein